MTHHTLCRRHGRLHAAVGARPMLSTRLDDELDPQAATSSGRITPPSTWNMPIFSDFHSAQSRLPAQFQVLASYPDPTPYQWFGAQFIVVQL
jgi:hypothetical protein